MRSKGLELAIAAAADKADRKTKGIVALARLLGMTAPAVSQWQDVPPARVLQVEKATGVSRYKLRPDIYGARAPRRAAS